MNNAKPTISICIPTFNQAHFLRDAIASVLAQTRSDFELVIVDNSSTDDTPKVVEEFMQRDGRIKYFRNEENIGAQNNFNRCLRYASGEYVKLLCSDDLLEPVCIERTAAILDRNPSVGLVSSARMFVREDLRPITMQGYSATEEIVTGASAISRCLTYGNLIGEPSATLFRRKLAARGLDVRYKQLIDLEFWFHILEQGDFGYIPEPLSKFRLHRGQDTRAHFQSLTAIDDEFRLFNEYSRRPYVRMSPWNRLRARYRTAVAITALEYPGIDIRLLRGKSIAQYGTAVTAIVLFIKKVRRLLTER